jgi:O-antigen/teichoic acid export membrane protein
MVATVVINIALVPKYGAVGAAIATTLMLIVQPVLKQVGLMEVPGLKVFDKQCVSFCGILAAATAVLFLAKMMSANHLYVACLLSLLASAAVLLLSRGNLDIKDTFPESLRVPFLKRLVA